MKRFALLALIAAFPGSPASACERAESELTLARSSRGRTLRWEFADLSSLLARGELSGKALRHAEWVRKNTSMGPRENLENHARVGEKIARDLRPGDPFLSQISKSRRKVDAILRGEVGEIMPIRCLELLPFEQFLEVVDLRSFAGELLASVLVKGRRAVIIGDYYKQDMEGGARESVAAGREREKLLRQGWKLEASLHNHPFSFSNPYGDIGGTLGPSDPDVASYKAQKPSFGIITNGIDTIAMPRPGYEALD